VTRDRGSKEGPAPAATQPRGLTPRLELAGAVEQMGPDLPRGAHRTEDAFDNLGGAGPVHLVGALRLEKLGMREDDAEFVVQAMEQASEFIDVVESHLLDSSALCREAHRQP